MAKRGKKIVSQSLKKALVILVLFSGVVFPLACDTNKNPGPAAPVVGPIPTSTSTGTLTPGTPTNTFSPVPGVNTATFTPTFATPTPPALRNIKQTSAAPRCMDLNGTQLTVAENEFSPVGIVTEFETYANAGTANLDLYNGGGGPQVGNVIATGCPAFPPAPTPAIFLPNLIGLHQVQGYINPGGNNVGGWSAVMDLTGGTSGTLYMGYYGSWNNPGLGVFLDQYYMPFNGTAYGGQPFNNPQGMCSDKTGNDGSIYIADTGRGMVDQLSPYDGTCPEEALPIHHWIGSQGVSVGGTGSVFKSAAVSFKSPYAVTCDTFGAPPRPNVWVGDTGYPNSYIQEYTSGGITILQSWQGITGCQVHGLAVDSATGNVYVADAGNNLVEVYTSTGTLLTAFGVPTGTASTPIPFSPSCIAFSGGYIYVGDINNDYIDIFQ